MVVCVVFLFVTFVILYGHIFWMVERG